MRPPPESPPPELIAGWGRVPVVGREIRDDDLERATIGATLTRGLGRSYGDASLPPPSSPQAVASPLADRMLAFDEETGLLRVEAGLSLLELNRVFLPRLWFTPVSPGTQYVTIGGMVAADIHGKNHHVEGCFGRHVTKIRIRVADDRIVLCSPEAHRDLFFATIGGMGLTGHMLEIEFRMKRITSPWIFAESEQVHDIDEFMISLKDAAKVWPYTVGWIDCLSGGAQLGRGVIIRGRFARADEAPATPPPRKRRIEVPFVCPSWLLSSTVVRTFNEVNFALHEGGTHRGIQHPEDFFYPLDKLLSWNRLYGPRGFTQYQCVMPDSAGPNSARRFLELLTSRGGASFLCVIKDSGAQGEGVLSFPLRGISIALDIAIRDDTQGLIDALNELVIREGGRIYLAKDQFTRAADFRAMEPRLDRFLAIRRTWDPTLRLRSAQSVRVLGDPA